MPTLFLRLALAIILPLALVACEDAAPAKRDIDVVYRFENMRKQVGAQSTGGLDEWAAVKPILDHASTRPVQVRTADTRTIGSLELSTYEARCTLPTLLAFQQVQSDLEALGTQDEHGERIEPFLSQVTATYKTNFVAATVNVAVSGSSVAGHKIRVYSDPNQPPAETTAGWSGIWVARLAVVPQTSWVYGLSEDPTGRIPTRYFRINVNTRKQERVEEPDFLRLFPALQPAPPPTRTQPTAAKPAAATTRDRTVAEQRKHEEEEFRQRIAQEDAQYQKRRTGQTAAAPNGG